MTPEFATCGAEELPQLVGALDAEFVTSKGRSVSLATRFPGVFSRANLEHLYLVREGPPPASRIVAALAVKPFRWIAAKAEYTGAMVGAVWVHPGHRRSGLGSALLKHTQSALKERFDFAVLWTAQPAFYARCGWVASDANAVFGETTGNGGGTGEPVDFAVLRAIWQQQAQFAAREALWQAPLPLPAIALEAFCAPGAYAIAGRDGDTLYCHEMLGDENAFATLLTQMRGCCKRLCCNLRLESPAQRALTAQGVSFQAKPLAMWLPLRRDVAAAARDWYVPWLDRI